MTIVNKNDDSEFLHNHIRELVHSCLEQVNPDVWIGKKFSDWKVTEVLHYTSKSLVLKAKPSGVSHNQDVAIKIISPFFFSTANSKITAMQAHYLEKLKCRNMVEMKSYGTTDDNIHFMVMEYLPDGDIVSYCDNNKLSIKKRLELFTEVCDGVIHMHKHMVIHADIKPQNILISRDGTPKIIDLDLSIALNSKFNDSFDYQNISGFTKKYASPEQINDQSISVLSDVYSLGVLLQKMLICSPCNGINYKLLKEQYPNDKYLKELISIINKSQEFRPVQRFDSVGDLKNDVIDFINQKRIVKSHLPRASIFYKAFRYINSRIALFSMITLVLLITCVSVKNIIDEKNHAKRNLMVATLNKDPRNINSQNIFDAMASEEFSRYYFNNQDKFNSLISIGDAYYGQGRSKKAERFIVKAIDLFPEMGTHNHIKATTKLAKIYYDLNRKAEADELIRPYYDLLFVKDLTSVPLIRMLLATLEINEHAVKAAYSDYISGNYFELLNNVNLAGFEDLQTKKEVEATLLLKKAITIYRKEYGDLTYITFNHSDSYNEKVSYPLLHECRSLLISALNIIKLNDLSSHIEPQIYSWLSRVEIELGNEKTALNYSTLGVKKTLAMFGESHVRTSQAISFHYVVLRLIDTASAKATAISLNKMVNGSNFYSQNRILAYSSILVDAYFNNGQFNEVINMIEMYLETQFPTDDLSYISHVSSLSTEITQFSFLFPNYLKKYAQLEYELEGIIKDENEYFTINRMTHEALNGYKVTTKEVEDNIEILKKRYIDEFDYIAFNPTNVILTYSEICILSEKCDIDIILSHYFYNYHVSTKETEIYPIHLSRLLRLTNIYLKINRVAKAEETLNLAKKIIDYHKYKNNYFTGIYSMLFAEILFTNGDIDTSKVEAKKAIVDLSLHINVELDVVNRLQHILEAR